MRVVGGDDHGRALGGLQDAEPVGGSGVRRAVLVQHLAQRVVDRLPGPDRVLDPAPLPDLDLVQPRAVVHAITRQPGRFAALTFVVPPTAWGTRAAKADDYRAAAELVERQGMAAFVEAGRLAPRPPATVEAPETVPDVAEELLPTLLRGAALTDLPSEEELAGITVPTTILAWTDDPAHPLSTAQALHDVIRGSRLVVASTPAELGTWPARLHQQVVEVSGRQR